MDDSFFQPRYIRNRNNSTKGGWGKDVFEVPHFCNAHLCSLFRISTLDSVQEDFCECFPPWRDALCDRQELSGDENAGNVDARGELMVLKT